MKGSSNVSEKAILILCLVLGGVSFWQSISSSSSGTESAELAQRLSRAETQLEASKAMLLIVKQEVARMEELTVVAQNLEAVPKTQEPVSSRIFTDQDEYESLSARIVELERLFLKEEPSRKTRPRKPTHEEVMEILKGELGQQALQEFRSVLLNPNEDWARRIAALQLLNQFPEDIQAIDDSVMSEVLLLIASGIETDQKRDLLRALDHHTSQRFLKAMRVLATSEESDRVREEAIDALSFMRNDPEIKAFLEQLAENDHSQDIREEAAKALRDFE